LIGSTPARFGAGNRSLAATEVINRGKMRRLLPRPRGSRWGVIPRKACGNGLAEVIGGSDQLKTVKLPPKLPLSGSKNGLNRPFEAKNDGLVWI